MKGVAASICFALFVTPAGTAQGPYRGPVSGAIPELATQERPAAFKAGTNLVLVPVVVRDDAGRAVGNLTRKDFKLFDRGKRQEILKFSREGSEGNSAAPAGGTTAKPAPAAPERFVAYLFDDMHIGLEELQRVRRAALRRLATLQTGERAAIFTTSGQVALEFTSDRERLRRTIERLGSHWGVRECFHLGYYWADLVEKGDPQAMAGAMRLAYSCYGPVSGLNIKVIARQQITEGELETRVSLSMLRTVVHRMVSTPGQRTVVLASPGFYAPPDSFDLSDIFDTAARANVVVNCLNSLGLVAPSGEDIGQAGRNFNRERDTTHSGTLAEIAEATGGSYFHNNNDLDAGLRQLGAAPEFHYVLGFYPQDLRLDGRFHALRVSLAKPRGLSVTVRRGYYATARMGDPEKAADQEINDALFSNANIGGLPFELRTTVSQSPEGKPTLEVSAWMDPRELRMHKQGALNHKALTVAFGLFDQNGNVLATTRKDVGLKVRDLDLEKMSGRWVAVKASFPVKPGGYYMVRAALRDSDEQLVSSEHLTVEVSKQQ